ncbi:ClbS/DfsB family four-helix bundle protein [Pedobacter sp. ok626]|nr:ClbS/DfsB family four-helix bundle protein [Pedobacter sp. ok626]
MSINNLLAYLIGWGELVLKWNRKKDNNEPVDFPDTGYQWNELGKLVIC